MNAIVIALVICIVLIGGFLGIGEALRCDHVDTWEVYSFQFENSTASNSVREVCKECHKNMARPALFKGTLVDKSYLEAVKEHSDAQDFVPGEYYTITAIVTQADYDSVDKPRIGCKVENEDFLVGFSVEFREEFAEAVSYKSLEKGVEITFRGRLYDEGFGFTDCELLSEVK